MHWDYLKLFEMEWPTSLEQDISELLSRMAAWQPEF